jgi:hypothetical protein
MAWRLGVSLTAIVMSATGLSACQATDWHGLTQTLDGACTLSESNMYKATATTGSFPDLDKIQGAANTCASGAKLLAHDPKPDEYATLSAIELRMIAEKLESYKIDVERSDAENANADMALINRMVKTVNDLPNTMGRYS